MVELKVHKKEILCAFIAGTCLESQGPGTGEIGIPLRDDMISGAAAAGGGGDGSAAPGNAAAGLPSRSRVLRSQFSLPAANEVAGSKFRRKVSKATFSLPGGYLSFHRRQKNSSTKGHGVQQERERKESYRSGKHDYRNPSSDYSVNDIAGLLRRTAELDRHSALHPLLTKDFLLDLQLFGLLPSSEDDEEDDEEDEDGYEEDDEWELGDIRSRTATLAIGSSLEEDVDRVRPTGRRVRHSLDMGRSEPRKPAKTTASLRIRPQIKRWASPSSFRLKQLASPLLFIRRSVPLSFTNPSKGHIN